MFYFKNFIILALVFRSVIFFFLVNCLCSVRLGSRFTFFCMDIYFPFSNIICWKNCSFLSWTVLFSIEIPFLKNHVIINERIYFQTLYTYASTLSLDFCCFVKSFEIRDYESSNFVLFFFFPSRLFCLFWMSFISVCFKINLLIYVKSPADILVENTLNPYISLGTVVIITVLRPLIHKCGNHSIYLGLITFFSTVTCWEVDLYFFITFISKCFILMLF